LIQDDSLVREKFCSNGGMSYETHIIDAPSLLYKLYRHTISTAPFITSNQWPGNHNSERFMQRKASFSLQASENPAWVQFQPKSASIITEAQTNIDQYFKALVDLKTSKLKRCAFESGVSCSAGLKSSGANMLPAPAPPPPSDGTACSGRAAVGAGARQQEQHRCSA
jgi:hypothetical protein